MKIPDEVTCKVCKRFFCCPDCRYKHEIKNHAIIVSTKSATARAASTNHVGLVNVASEPPEPNAEIYVLCPICSNKPLPLHKIMYAEVLDHIKRHHLPLRCQKCGKIFTKIDDLRTFSKCIQSSSISKLEEACSVSAVASNSNVELKIQKCTISTQTSPLVVTQGADLLTPTSMINYWKHKSKLTQGFISDSVSSIKNLSMVSESSSIQRSVGSVTGVESKAKLVRTTSTPVNLEMGQPKPKEQTFEASNGQVSSIHSSGSVPDNQISPAAPNTGGSFPTAQPTANLQRKMAGRTKAAAAVTPLRQVMSKSIQKAFAEHGIRSFSDQKLLEFQEFGVAFNMPLDLRLSPALRRTQSEESYGMGNPKYIAANKESTPPLSSPSPLRIVTAKKLTKKSLVVTHSEQSSSNHAGIDVTTASSTSSSSVYKTCETLEIVTSTEDLSDNENEINNDANDELHPLLSLAQHNGSLALASITPITRQSGAMINKQAIKFETPKVQKENGSPIREKYYTPSAATPELLKHTGLVDGKNKRIPVARSLSERFSTRPRIDDIYDCGKDTAEAAFSNNEVRLAQPQGSNNSNAKHDSTTAGGFLWSLMSSVMRLRPLKGSRAEETTSHTKPSIIKRCASIAGSLVRSSSLVDETKVQTMKRKRSDTMDNQWNSYKTSSSEPSSPTSWFSNESKRLRIHTRIQARKPIH